MQAVGYRFHLYFFWLPSADMAVERVAARVASGGHHIPEEAIRRRYGRGIENFFNHYAPAADTWVLVNNTARTGTAIARHDIGSGTIVEDNDLWFKLASRYMKPKAEEPRVFPHPDQPWTSQDIVDAVNRAVTAALRRHKERGEYVIMWRDGRVVRVEPEDIEVSEEERSA